MRKNRRMSVRDRIPLLTSKVDQITRNFARDQFHGPKEETLMHIQNLVYTLAPLALLIAPKQKSLCHQRCLLPEISEKWKR